MSKPVLKFDLSNQKVLDFVPPKFELGTPEAAMGYLETKRSKANSFRMNDAIRVQTGVKQIEDNEKEDTIERQVLEKLKSVQESAYQEAYQLGLHQGKQEAFTKNDQDIKQKLEEFDKLLSGIMNLKKELILFNENHVVELAFHMAKRLAHKEVESDPQVVVQVIKDAIEKAQLDEQITVQVNPTQMEYIEKLRTETAREFEFLKKIKLEPVADITPGGCIIHTNYSEIDARFEERVSKLWSALDENLPKVKDQVKS